MSDRPHPSTALPALYSPISRRHLLAGASTMLATRGALAGEDRAAEFVSGAVLEHRPDANDAASGIGGVMVSNGVDVVATGLDGRWRLPAHGDGHVFLIKPSGWEIVPDRSPRSGFAHCLADCRDRNVNFQLRRIVESSRFDVALVADTQPQSQRELDYLRDSILPAVADSGAPLAINHGDVVFDEPGLLPRYQQLIAATGMTWHHCPGNHDMDLDRDRRDCFATWRTIFGPCHYAFQFGGATFILLNNVERLTKGQRTPAGYDYRGAIGEAQLAFVKGILEHVPRDQLVVVSMHIPLVGFEDPNEPSGITADRDKLMALLVNRPNTLSLAGHTHTTEHHYLGAEHGFAGPGLHHHHVLTAACGSWWSGPYDPSGLPLAESRDGTPKGFHILSVDGNRYTTRFVPVGHGGDGRIRAMIVAGDGTIGSEQSSRQQLQRSQIAGAHLLVNVFDGGPRTRVSFEIKRAGTSAGSSTQCMAMDACRIKDPITAETFGRHRDVLKPWVEAADSSHMWQAPLPSRLATGTYQVKINVTDEYARGYSASTLLEVGS